MLKKREKEKEKERKKIKTRAKHRREESTRIPAATQWWSINVEHCGRIKRIVKVKLKTPHRSSWVTVMSGGGAEGEAPSGASSLPAFSLPVSLSLKRSNETLENHATTQRSPNTILHINITILVYLFFSPSKKVFLFSQKKKKRRERQLKINFHDTIEQNSIEIYLYFSRCSFNLSLYPFTLRISRNSPYNPL